MAANVQAQDRHGRIALRDTEREYNTKAVNRLLEMVGLLAVGLLTVGCVYTTATMLGTASHKREPIEPKFVKLYTTAAQIKGKYEEVALLHSEGEVTLRNEALMYESMREEAGKLGANGIILDAMSEPSAGAKIAAWVLSVPAYRKGKALAVYVYPEGEEPFSR